MKRALLVLTVFLALSLAGCDEGGTISVAPGELSADAQELLDMLGDEILFFDYSVGDSAKSMSVDLWMCRDGQWERTWRAYGDVDEKRGRVGLRIMENGYNVFCIGAEGVDKGTILETVDLSGCTMIQEDSLRDQASVELGDEITLWAQLGTDQNSMRIGAGMDFRNSECSTGAAFTLTFSDVEIE